jgi:hypothetical protein
MKGKTRSGVTNRSSVPELLLPEICSSLATARCTSRLGSIACTLRSTPAFFHWSPIISPIRVQSAIDPAGTV